jgi:hypothetical protein
MFKGSKSIFIPLTFNGFPDRLILRIAELAHNLLLEKNPNGIFPIPFINKNDVGSYATFKCQGMADKVTQLVDQVVSHDFPDFSNMRLVKNLFHLSIDSAEEENFIYYVDEKTFFLLHPYEGMAQKTIEKMNQMLERYMIQYPIVLISELLPSCAVKLMEEEILIIPCGMQTFLKPIYAKENQFMKNFSKTLERVSKLRVDCKGIEFYEVKDICKEIEIKGVYFFITPEYIELTGLPFNVKGFSEILKRRLKEQHTESRVLSRK